MCDIADIVKALLYKKSLLALANGTGHRDIVDLVSYMSQFDGFEGDHLRRRVYGKGTDCIVYRPPGGAPFVSV